MDKRKKVFSIVACLSFLTFLIVVHSDIGRSAPAEKPITGKEWAEKIGLDWGPKYWPTKPVRGGIMTSASPLYIGLMNPHHWPINDWGTIGLFYEKFIYTDGKNKPVVPWLAES